MGSITFTSKAVSPMPKALTILAMVVAVLLFLVFALDAAVGIPFGQASLTMDVGVIVAAGALGFLSFAAYRDLK